MTDTEIKILEGKITSICKNCDTNTSCLYCVYGYVNKALDEINRQKAEIKRLEKALDVVDIMEKQHRYALNKAKAEAIKEYEKKVIEKTLAMVYSCDLLSTEDYIECIQSIGKEMVGDV